MIFKLFLTFFKIGLFTFGGGYAMIAQMREYVVNKEGVREKRRNLYLLVKRNATLEEVSRFRKSISPSGKKDSRQNLLKLFAYDPSAVRDYPKGSMLANLLGYVDIENDMMKPRSGLETRFNKTMSPDKVKNIIELTPSGHPIIFGKNLIHEPANGKDLFLTIVEPVQAILEEELDAVVEKWRPDAIFAAVADPRTGEILAIAQRPTFNPADRSTYKAHAVRMRCAEDIYEPGSLAKPFSVLLALEKKLVTPESLVDCENGRWGAVRLTDSHPYGKLTVACWESGHIRSYPDSQSCFSSRICRKQG